MKEQVNDASETGKALAHNEVKLSDGRIVKIREAKGSDEMIVSGELGSVFEPNGGGAVIFQNCLIAKTIIALDGQPVEPLKGFERVRDFAAQFSSKDWNKIKKLYDKLNSDEGN